MGTDVQKGINKDKLIKRTILILQLAVLALVAAFAIYYIQTRQSVASLPAIGALARGVAPHYMFSMYDVSEPHDVAVSPDGQRIYATETNGERKIRVYDRQGNQLQAITQPSSDVVPMPIHIATGPDGDVYVSESLRSEVDVYAPDGTYLRAYKHTDIDGGLAPAGLAVTARGDLDVVDSINERVLSIGPDNSLLMKVQMQRLQGNQRVYADALTIDRRGRLFVADTLSNAIQVFDQDGNTVSDLDNKIAVDGLIQGLYADNNDQLYAVDTTNDDIEVYDISSNVPKKLYTFGATGIGDGQFRYPCGITVDASGRIYIADRINNRVQVWSY